MKVTKKRTKEKIIFVTLRDWLLLREKLTQEIITEALTKIHCLQHIFWLELHHFSSEIDISVFDELQPKHVKEFIKNDLFCGLNDLKEEINKFDKLSNAQKPNLVAKIEKLA